MQTVTLPQLPPAGARCRPPPHLSSSVESLPKVSPPHSTYQPHPPRIPGSTPSPQYTRSNTKTNHHPSFPTLSPRLPPGGGGGNPGTTGAKLRHGGDPPAASRVTRRVRGSSPVTAKVERVRKMESEMTREYGRLQGVYHLVGTVKGRLAVITLQKWWRRCLERRPMAVKDDLIAMRRETVTHRYPYKSIRPSRPVIAEPVKKPPRGYMSLVEREFMEEEARDRTKWESREQYHRERLIQATYYEGQVEIQDAMIRCIMEEKNQRLWLKEAEVERRCLLEEDCRLWENPERPVAPAQLSFVPQAADTPGIWSNMPRRSGIKGVRPTSGRTKRRQRGIVLSNEVESRQNIIKDETTERRWLRTAGMCSSQETLQRIGLELEEEGDRGRIIQMSGRDILFRVEPSLIKFLPVLKEACRNEGAARDLVRREEEVEYVSYMSFQQSQLVAVLYAEKKKREAQAREVERLLKEKRKQERMEVENAVLVKTRDSILMYDAVADMMQEKDEKMREEMEEAEWQREQAKELDRLQQERKVAYYQRHRHSLALDAQVEARMARHEKEVSDLLQGEGSWSWTVPGASTSSGNSKKSLQKTTVVPSEAVLDKNASPRAHYSRKLQLIEEEYNEKVYQRELRERQDKQQRFLKKSEEARDLAAAAPRVYAESAFNVYETRRT